MNTDATISQKYREIMQALERGDRYQKPLLPDECEFIRSKLQEVKNLSHTELDQILCIATNTATFIPNIENALNTILREIKNNSSLVYALNCSRRQIIAAQFRQGRRLSADFLDGLMLLLDHKDPEIVEWTLRTIEECGSQAIYFRAKLKTIRPSIFKLFNRHQRAILELIEYLERKWSVYEKAGSK
jgi:hypothetical protein